MTSGHWRRTLTVLAALIWYVGWVADAVQDARIELLKQRNHAAR